ncbi:MAG: hypothetical protein DRG27_06275, partial [Deltaproteobacteria bacterium]
MPKKKWTKKELEEKKKQLEERLKEIAASEVAILRRLKEYREKHGSKFFRPFPYQQKVIDLLHQGKKIVVFQGGNQIGKEQPYDAIVYTPDGAKTMEEIEVGDYVIGADGQPHRVVGTYDQGIKPVYRVTFDDGSSTECGLDHLWLFIPPSRRFKKLTRFGNPSPCFKKYMIRPLKYILLRWGSHPKPGQRISIPVCLPVQFKCKRNFIIHPYILGVLIGDGALTCNSVGVSCHDKDLEILEKCKRLIPDEMKIVYRSAYDYNFIGKNHGTNIFLSEIRRLGLNVKSESKFIPDEYKYTSAENRIELLKGLMDTDGS